MTKINNKVIGTLMILIFITGIFSIVAVLETPEYLENLPSHLNELYRGVFFQFLMVAIYLALIVLINPLIMAYSKNLSNYFIVAKSISISFHLIGIILLMLFIPLSNAYVVSSDEVYRVMGEMLRIGRDLTNHLGVIVPYLVGSLVFYYVLYKRQYISKWLIILGFVGIAFALLASILILFNMISIVSTGFMILSLPLAVQELLLAIVLIMKKKDFTISINAG